jgi:hypothetical protein
MREPADADRALIDTAREALFEITDPETVGAVAGIDDSVGVVDVYFASTMSGYPSWRWNVSVSTIDGDEYPSVLEAELLPGEGALLAPDWVPWADRLADYRAAQAESADGDNDDDEDLDDDDDDESDLDDDLDDDDDLDVSDDDDSDDDDDDDDLVDSDVLDRDDEIDGVDFESSDFDEQGGNGAGFGGSGTPSAGGVEDGLTTVDEELSASEHIDDDVDFDDENRGDRV